MATRLNMPFFYSAPQRIFRCTVDKSAVHCKIIFGALLLFFLCSGSLRAQTEQGGGVEWSWETFVEEYLSLSGEEDEEGEDEQLLLDLYEIHLHPLNLNAFDIREFRELPFLDEMQLIDLMDYALRHRPVLSTGELMAVRSLDWRTRRLLQLFCTAGPTGGTHTGTLLDTLINERRKPVIDNELTVRGDIPLYTKVGFANYSAEELAASPNKVYQGSQPYLSLRYTLNVDKRVEAGLMLEKDVGEEGVDYWAAYAVLHQLGAIETLAVGHFRASFGLGLAINNGTSFGKMMMLSSIGRTDRGFRRHSSMSETGYLQGAGVTVRVGESWRLSAYASSKDTDGTINSDSTGLSSLKTDGLHRTLLEKSKKGIVTKTDVGGNVQWQRGRWKLSGTVAYTHYSIPLMPKYDTTSSLYRLYNAQGTDFLVGSLCYGYTARRVRFTGETAMSKGGHLATLNMLQTELSGHKLTLIFRSYDKQFVSVNGRSFSENSSPQNESGLYVGWSYNLSRHWQAQAYVDGMYFPWMKYQVSGSSYAVDAQAQLVYNQGAHNLSLRYRVKSKQRDISITDSTAQLMFSTTQSLRLVHTWQATKQLSLKTSAIGSCAHRPDTGSEWGFSLGEQLTWRKRLHMGRRTNTLRLTGGLTYFHTDSYSARVYAYEPGMRYSFNMRAFYYHGLRAVAMASVPIVDGLDVTAKIGCTKYFDRETIGTGLDEILQSHREDIQLQAHWKF